MNSVDGPRAGGQLQEALDLLACTVKEGARHGFFEVRVTCEVGSAGKRHMVIHAGKSHKFVFPLNEIAKPNCNP
jgi:hypothetical protein